MISYNERPKHKIFFPWIFPWESKGINRSDMRIWSHEMAWGISVLKFSENFTKHTLHFNPVKCQTARKSKISDNISICINNAFYIETIKMKQILKRLWVNMTLVNIVKAFETFESKNTWIKVIGTHKKKTLGSRWLVNIAACPRRLHNLSLMPPRGFSPPCQPIK